MRRVLLLVLLLLVATAASADTCPNGRTPNLCMKSTSQQLLNDNFNRIDEAVGAILPSPWTPDMLGHIDAGVCRVSSPALTAAAMRVCSNDTTEHTFAIYNDSGGGMKQVLIVENNGDGLGGTPTDVNLRNAVLNMGDPTITNSGQVPIIFMNPSGTATHNVISIMKSGENTDGQAVFTVNSLGALTLRSGGTSSTAASLCATSDTSCSSPRWRMDEFGRQLWLRNIEQAVTVADNGAGTAAAATLTPTSTTINITCNDTNGCDITMSETGAVTHTALQITNVSANTVNFADSSGVSELAGAFAAGQWDTIAMRYVTDRWVETGRSNN